MSRNVLSHISIAALALGTGLLVNSTHAQQVEDEDLWISPDGLDAIMNAPIDSGPFAGTGQNEPSIEDAVFSQNWACETDPPGDEVGVTTRMSIQRDENFPAVIIETNYIPNAPKPIEVDILYGAKITPLENGQLKFTSIVSAIGEIRNWPEGVEQNLPDSIEMEVIATSPTSMAGWSRSYGVTSSMTCKPQS